MKNEEIEQAQDNVVEISEGKVRRMLKKIIVLEANNIKTKRFNDFEMSNRIKEIIEEEAECY